MTSMIVSSPSLNLRPCVPAQFRRNSLAAGLALALHGGVLAVLMHTWSVSPPTPAAPAVLHTQLVMLAPSPAPTPPVAEPLLAEPVPAPAVVAPPPEPVIGKDRRTGLPLIGCRHQPAQGESSPRRMAAILLEQEAGWIHDAGG